MSQNVTDAEIAQELEAVVPLIYFYNYVIVGTTAMWAYDFLLTFGQEVSHIWTRNATGTSILFVLNRYLFLFYNVVNVLQTFLPNPGNSCNWIIDLSGILAAIVSGTSAGLLALRIFAIWNSAWGPFLLLLTLAVARIVLGLVRNFAYSTATTDDPLAGCSSVVVNDTLYTRFAAADNSLVLAFESIVFILTIIKTFSQVLQARRLQLANGLSYFLLRDGTIYYVPLLIETIAALVFTQVVIHGTNSTAVNDLQAFTAILFPKLQNMLVNRLVLSLRQANKTEMSVPALSSMHFTAENVFGNIGEPMSQFDDDDDSEDRTDALGGSEGEKELVELDLAARHDDSLPGSEKA